MRVVSCAFDYAPQEPKLCWVITQRCNLSCAHCCSSSGPNQTSDIDIEAGKLLLQRAAALGIKRIIFTGGEPLLAGALSILITLATSLGMRASLSTNGTLVSVKIADSLFNIGIRKATVSLDGDAEQHDKLRQKGGAFASAVLGAKALSQAGIRVTLNCLLRPEVIAHLDKIYEVAVEVGAPEVTFTFPLRAGRMNRMLDTYSATWKEGDDFLSAVNTAASNWEAQVQTTIFQPRCGTPLCPAGKSVFGSIGSNHIVSCVYTAYDQHKTSELGEDRSVSTTPI